MSALYPSLAANQAAEEMEMQNYPEGGRFSWFLCLLAWTRTEAKIC